VESNVEAADSNKHSSLLVAAVARVRSPTRETFIKEHFSLPSYRTNYDRKTFTVQAHGVLTHES